MEVVRLGQGVDRTGRLAPEALARTFAACDTYAEVIRRTGAEQVRFVATSATRDVQNRDEFVAGVRDRFGVEPEVVTGDDEAELSFAGATRELAGSELPHPFLVVDIGGGSTELVLGEPGAAPQAARSVDVGLRADDRAAPARRPADGRAGRRAPGPTSRPRSGWPARRCRWPRRAPSSGWPARSRRSRRWRSTCRRTCPERIHHARIPAADVRRVTDRLLAMTHDERAALPFMHPGRVDVIGAGALVLAVVLEHVPVDEVLVSEHDILDGIAWSCAERDG